MIRQILFHLGLLFIFIAYQNPIDEDPNMKIYFIHFGSLTLALICLILWGFMLYEN